MYESACCSFSPWSHAQRLQRLGRGAQGTVYVAEYLLDKKKYVIKMVSPTHSLFADVQWDAHYMFSHFIFKQVECNDASEAEKAFKEVGP